MIPLCRDEGIGLIPWSPLARGFLAGNRTRENHGEQAARRPTILPTSCITKKAISRSSNE